MGYLTPRWLVVYGYLLIVLIATPYLPLLIQWASTRWPAVSIASFVLVVEISIGVLLIISAGAIFFFNIRKFPRFFLIIGALITFSSIFYLITPNPYELTHLPEYAILGILVMRAIKETEGRRREKMSETSSYLQSAAITCALGAIDELYQGILPSRFFAWYDIFLNGVGGLLGLTIFWGIRREKNRLYKPGDWSQSDPGRYN